ncbi:MAG: DUF2227 family putative metal-binding protein [Chlamydiia bacterium]|nr:DUF2227 family putative metal-binding protein [Chlamydiia bacterium]
MALYKQHAQFNLFIALPILLGALYYFLHPGRPHMLTFAAAFAYSTLFMNPDLDLAHQIRLFSIRGLLTLPFRSYSKFFRHRGLSHHPFLGSLTRILWLALWGALISLILYKTLPSHKSIKQFYKRHELFILYGFAGVCLSDWSHLLLDRKEAKGFHKK